MDTCLGYPVYRTLDKKTLQTLKKKKNEEIKNNITKNGKLMMMNEKWKAVVRSGVMYFRNIGRDGSRVQEQKTGQVDSSLQYIYRNEKGSRQEDDESVKKTTLFLFAYFFLFPTIFKNGHWSHRTPVVSCLISAMRLLSCVGSIASTLLVLHSADAGMTGLGHLVKRPTFPEHREFQAELAEAIASGTIKNATFRQLIDHRRPELGTFSQRYFYNSEWYAGPGAPIILRTPDEAEVSPGYANNNSQAAVFAKTNGAAVIALEHRYYGESSPFTNLTTTNLQHLTLENALQDIVYFAKNVVLPFDVKRSSSPDKAPWVLTGCSYSGSLAAWIYRLYPGTFWAHHCSSAPVEAITDFWQYFEPAREAMPKNCSTDLVNVVKHIDRVLSSGDAKAAYALKKKFGFEALSHSNDFGFAILTPFWYLQNRWFGDSGADPFYRFCDYIEVSLVGAF